MAQNQRKKFLQPRFWVLISAVLLVVFLFAFVVQYVRLQTQQQTLLNLQQERQTLMDEVSELMEQMEYMQTNEYIEQAAREQLGMLLPDEIRYVPSGQ